ncbi:MAG: serine hydrolase [Rhodospirillales bacterium]|nr:serine hydrolase [Rhodospirillales bacterium]
MIARATLALLLLAAPAGAQTFSDTGPDANDYGAREGYPAAFPPGQFRNPHYLVGRFSSSATLTTTRLVERAGPIWAFKRAPVPIEIAYNFRGQPRSLALYLANHPTTGLLVLKDDTILFEAYQYARTDRQKFLSQSMAKTVTAMLVGIAVAEGRIASIDDPVEKYVTGLKGKEYGGSSIRALLHMSSGVAYREDYSGEDDNARMGRGLYRVSPGGQAAVVGQFNERTAPPLTRFHYASVETEILGLVLAAATGRPVAEYLSEKIWRHLGAEADAHWQVDGGGQEMTYCCLNATLRDYARLGRLLAHDGNWNGRQLIPRQWVIDATTVPADKPFLAPTPQRFGYGYQVWLVPGPVDEPQRRVFVLLGIHGQAIFVDPASKLVMVQTAVRKLPSNDPKGAETNALWRALLAKHAKP